VFDLDFTNGADNKEFLGGALTADLCFPELPTSSKITAPTTTTPRIFNNLFSLFFSAKPDHSFNFNGSPQINK